MKSSSTSINEIERINELNHYKIIDTLPEDLFDDITQLASQICCTPIAVITLVDVNRQWFKSKTGLDITETPRDVSFCGHAILGNGLFEIPNAIKDPRFFDNPLVVGEPNIRFYAGLPLVTKLGFKLGTLCVIDPKPNKLKPEQHASLVILGRQVVLLIENRLTTQDSAILSSLLEHTGDIAKVGGWQLETANMKTEWTKQVFNIHELQPPDLPSVAEAIIFLCPRSSTYH